MVKKKIQYIREIETIDSQTGEIIVKQTDSIIQIPSEPPFVKLYLEDLSNYHKLSGTGKDVLTELLSIMAYNTNEIVMPAAIRKRLAERLGLSINSFNNQFAKILSTNVISKIDDSIYRANPNLFGRGNWKENYKLRQELPIQLTLKYNPNGSKEITSSFDDEYENKTKQIN